MLLKLCEMWTEDMTHVKTLRGSCEYKWQSCQSVTSMMFKKKKQVKDDCRRSLHPLPREKEADHWDEDALNASGVDIKTEGCLTGWVTVFFFFALLIYSSLLAVSSVCVSHRSPCYQTRVFSALFDCHGVSILGQQQASQQMAQGWHGHRAQEAVWLQA